MAKGTLPGFWEILTRRYQKFVNPNLYRSNGNYFDLLNDDPLVGLAADNSTKVNLIKVSSADVPTIPGDLAITGALALAAGGFTMSAIARTATADGTGTGTIASGPMLQFVAVTAGGDANAIIVLPAPTPGTIVVLHVAATGYELRTSAPATVGINGGTGASAESAIPANTTVLMICASATSWKGLQLGSDGTLAKVEVAA